jgi:hypothetical protein
VADEPITDPALSIIVPADRFADIAELAVCLRAQTVAGRIELVVPTTAPHEMAPDRPELRGLAGVVAVPVASVHPLPAARAAGVAAASAPVIFLGETHSLPEPDWAERLLAAHDTGWRRVTPVLFNGNPDGALSWAAFLLDYGSRASFLPSSPLAWAPVHNASYPAEWLRSNADALERLLDGYRRYAEGREPEEGAYRAADARMGHLNVSRPLHWAHERYLAGRLAGAARSADWSALRRAAYIAAAPLIVALLLWREVPTLRRAGLGSLPRLTVPAIVTSLALRVIGEAAAHLRLRGAGRASIHMDAYEIGKRRFTRGWRGRSGRGITGGPR